MNLLTTATIIAALAAPAMAAPVCVPRQEMIDGLAGKYTEARQAVGLSAKNHVLELFTSPGGSWTATITRADGMSCIVDHGDNFEFVPGAPPPEGDPT